MPETFPGKGDAYNDEVKRRLGSFFGRKAKNEEDPEVREMRHNRRVNAKTAGVAGAGRGGSQLSFATGRPRDPMFYWRQNNLPYDVSKDEELKKIREFCRILYLTHPIIASCIDIYSKYPLLGMELVCKDDQITEFYTTLFFDQMHYDEFLIDVGREYWMTGESWPFASFNEVLGVWEDEELLNPDDVEVIRSPFINEPRFLIRLPETLRKVVNEQSPKWEFEKLMASYPELRDYSGPDALMPVSNILLKQMKFKGDTFHKRGIPLLMRGFRAVMQEEMLNAAMDAIADRLYTPLILVRLGASATDLGTDVPWIPTEDDLADFEEALDGALAADFRVLTHHFGVQMEPVFGRENMPNMSEDFDRLEDRILQVFGLSRTMLSGADSGETYAADALNRDLISQLLTTYQAMIIRHFEDRARVVAEAQGHYDYDLRGGKRYVKMEEILEIDEETGEERIVEQPKLLIPELRMKTMNIADEESEQQFMEALRAAGVPISIKTRLVNVPINFEDEIEQSKDEQVQLAVAEQQTRKEIYQALRAEGLPIPADLRADFEPKAANIPGPAGEGVRTPLFGTDEVAMTPNLAPTGEDLAELPPSSMDPTTGLPMAVDPTTGMPGNVVQMPGTTQSQRPPESDEMREGMPKPAVLFRQASRMRKLAAEHFVPYDDSDEDPEDRRPHGKFGDPKHIGMRRYASVDPETPMDEWNEEAV